MKLISYDVGISMQSIAAIILQIQYTCGKGVTSRDME